MEVRVSFASVNKYQFLCLSLDFLSASFFYKVEKQSRGLVIPIDIDVASDNWLRFLLDRFCFLKCKSSIL